VCWCGFVFVGFWVGLCPCTPQIYPQRSILLILQGTNYPREFYPSRAVLRLTLHGRYKPPVTRGFHHPRHWPLLGLFHVLFFSIPFRHTPKLFPKLTRCVLKSGTASPFNFSSTSDQDSSYWLSSSGPCTNRSCLWRIMTDLALLWIYAGRYFFLSRDSYRISQSVVV